MQLSIRKNINKVVKEITIIKILKYLPLIFIGFIGINHNMSETGCISGMGIIFFIIILTSFYFIYLIILLIINIYKIFKNKANFDFVPIIITLFLLFLIWLTSQDFLKSKTLLSARISNVSEVSRLQIILNLKSNSKCYIFFSYGGEGCKYSYNYTIKNDSLEIEKSIINQSDSVLTNRYYIDRKQQKLIPITKSQKKYLSFDIENNLTGN